MRNPTFGNKHYAKEIQRSSIIITLEPEILYLAYLELEVTSSAIVGLNAVLASPNLP